MLLTCYLKVGWHLSIKQDRSRWKHDNCNGMGGSSLNLVWVAVCISLTDVNGGKVFPGTESVSWRPNESQTMTVQNLNRSFYLWGNVHNGVMVRHGLGVMEWVVSMKERDSSAWTCTLISTGLNSSAFQILTAVQIHSVILRYDAVLTWEPILRRNARYKISPQSWWTCKASETTICQPVNNPGLFTFWELRGGAVGWANALQAGRSQVRFPVVPLKFFRHNPSSRNMVRAFTQPLTEMSTRNIYWEVKAAGA